MMEKLEADQLFQMRQRAAEERGRVRVDGPRFSFLDNTIKQIDAELDRRKSEKGKK
jgi:hypothetical protein